MFDAKKIKADFPILSTKVHGHDLVYLDSGATAQKPSSVLLKIEQLYNSLNANIHRGVHHLSEATTQEYEAAREKVRSFIGAESCAEIIFTAGATSAINTVAYSFAERFIGRGDNVVVSEMEHHSNLVPWQMICQMKGAELRMLPFDDNGEIIYDKLDELVDERTRILSITQASNVLGTMPDLKRIIDFCHNHGVPVMVDGCQGVVHQKVNVVDMDCDFYAFSGHKLYGPTGIGVLYGKKSLLEDMPPFMGGGDMVSTVSFEKTTYAELPLKFEAGTSNYIGAIALGAAIDYVNALDRDAVARHEQALCDYALERLSMIEGLRIYGQSKERCSIVSFNIDGVHPYDLGMIIDKLGVAVRTGTHCAEPVMQHFGVTGTVRASFGLYNTLEDVDKLYEAVERAASMLR
ncbi:MAG: cysteine desulfurase [Rikenellaceae bacterium]